jgi:cytochrome c-type biogenesis protein CcmH/NrfG
MGHSTATLLQQADAFLEQGMLQQATALYSEICRNDPTASDAWLMLGMINGDAGNLTEAIRHLSKCLEIEPRTLDAHYSLARIYLLLKNDEQAYRHAIEATRDESYTEAWLLRSVLSAKRGEQAESEFSAAKVVQQTPQNVEGHVNLAHAQIELHKFGEAKKALETALRISPDRADAIHMHANN